MLKVVVRHDFNPSESTELVVRHGFYPSESTEYLLYSLLLTQHISDKLKIIQDVGKRFPSQ